MNAEALDSSLEPMSEISKCRDLVVPYCVGRGIDIGSQGDPVVPDAISFDLPVDEYAHYSGGQAGGLVTCRGDARALPFNYDEFDWALSSHLLEDFPPEETLGIVKEWLRVVKPGGRLILVLPDEPIFREHCLSTGQCYNHAHRNHVLTLGWFKENIVAKLENVSIEFETFPVAIYSFVIVLKKS